jgi:hypothetical protein
VTGSLNLSEVFATYGSRPVNLKINICSSNNVDINLSGTIYANIYAPQSKVTMGAGYLAGAAICNQLVMNGSSKIYFDESIPTFGAGIRLAK